MTQKKKEKEKIYIGEVLVDKAIVLPRGFGGVREINNRNQYHLYFKKFTKDDIEEKHDGYIKIFGCWHLLKYVFFYDDIYKPLRDKILKG